MSYSVGRWLARIALLVLLFCPRPALAEEPSEKARSYFRNGVELLQSEPPNYQDAYHQFRLAYEESGSWKVLGNLGLCALKLERDGEALAYYAAYLKEGGDEVDAEERAALERETLLITGNTGVLHLTASEARAEIVDTRSGSPVPPQAYQLNAGKLTLRLRAGTHVLGATSSDGRKRELRVVISPNKTTKHHFDFDATEAKAAGALDAEAGSAPPSTVRTIGFVTAGVGGLALIGAGVTGILAKNKDSDATSQCGPERDGENKPLCDPRAEADFDSAAKLARVTNILLIAGGAAAAAGVGMIVFGGPTQEQTGARPRPRATLRIAPAITPNGAALFAAGTL